MSYGLNVEMHKQVRLRSYENLRIGVLSDVNALQSVPETVTIFGPGYRDFAWNFFHCWAKIHVVELRERLRAREIARSLEAAT